MPRLSCWFIRASLIYLAIGFTLGALMLANKGLEGYLAWSRILPIHIELLLMGWFVQLALGMAFWILPRLQNKAPRGNEAFSWLAFVLLNLGIALVVTDAIFLAPVLTLVGRLVELGGVLLFVIGSWERIKPFGV
jgi:cbb3-type cytochrome oxidase subunit 1